MNIRIADNNDRDKWDSYVHGQPDASAYHLFAWKLAIEKAYCHKTYYLLAEENGKVTGILPLVCMKLPFIQGALVSLPFCDVGDVLAEEEGIREELIREAITLAGRLKIRYIELRGHYRRSSFQYIDLPVNTQSHKVRMMMDLPGSSEMLWEGFRAKLRSQIRKAEKNGLRFEWGGSEDINGYYAVFSRNMRDLGSPVHSKEWFDVILRHYDKNVRMGLVYQHKQLIGAGFMLSANKTVSIPWASTLLEYNKLSPNMMLYWKFLKYAADSGFTKFDFGRSTPDEGTYRFKEQWGAEPVPLYWSFISIDCTETRPKASAGSARNTAARLWQKLPLGVANFIGPVIRKHISL
jgi:FemAB-related protein (PEP-CTERM system-associated)